MSDQTKEGSHLVQLRTSKLGALLEGIPAVVLLIVTGVILGVYFGRLESWKRPALVVSYGLLLVGLLAPICSLLALFREVGKDEKPRQSNAPESPDKQQKGID